MFHKRFSSLIERIMKPFRGTLIEMTEKKWLIGFNLSIPFRDHAISGIRFALKIFNNYQQTSSSSLVMNVVTGNCSIGILGSDQQKREVVFGELFCISQQLSLHAKRLNVPILINKECKNQLQMGKQTKKFNNNKMKHIQIKLNIIINALLLLHHHFLHHHLLVFMLKKYIL